MRITRALDLVYIGEKSFNPNNAYDLTKHWLKVSLWLSHSDKWVQRWLKCQTSGDENDAWFDVRMHLLYAIPLRNYYKISWLGEFSITDVIS